LWARHAAATARLNITPTNDAGEPARFYNADRTTLNPYGLGRSLAGVANELAYAAGPFARSRARPASGDRRDFEVLGLLLLRSKAAAASSRRQRAVQCEAVAQTVGFVGLWQIWTKHRFCTAVSGVVEAIDPGQWRW
jgi:hypothetical protein